MVTIQFQSTTLNASFYVAKGTGGNLLGCQTAEQLGILKITINTAVSSYNARIKDEFPNFVRWYCMRSKEHPSPVTYRHQRYTQTAKHRRIPFHIRKDVEMEL